MEVKQIFKVPTLFAAFIVSKIATILKVDAFKKFNDIYTVYIKVIDNDNDHDKRTLRLLLG